jgi:hypothetical protein
MTKFVYIGEYLSVENSEGFIYNLMFGDLLELEETKFTYLYKTIRIRDDVSEYIGTFNMPNDSNFMPLTEWRDRQIDKILEDD